MKKYKIEVKAFNHIIEKYESNNIKRILEKYKHYLSRKLLGCIFVYENKNNKWVIIGGNEK